MLLAMALELRQQTQVQVAPFAHRFGELVALLPAVHAMLGCPFLLVGTRLCLLFRILCTQSVLERIQHVGDVIDELTARTLGSRIELGIDVDGEAPRGKNGLASAREVFGERSQLRSRGCRLIHRSSPERRQPAAQSLHVLHQNSSGRNGES